MLTRATSYRQLVGDDEDVAAMDLFLFYLFTLCYKGIQFYHPAAGCFVFACLIDILQSKNLDLHEYNFYLN